MWVLVVGRSHFDASNLDQNCLRASLSSRLVEAWVLLAHHLEKVLHREDADHRDELRHREEGLELDGAVPAAVALGQFHVFLTLVMAPSLLELSLQTKVVLVLALALVEWVWALEHFLVAAQVLIVLVLVSALALVALLRVGELDFEVLLDVLNLVVSVPRPLMALALAEPGAVPSVLVLAEILAWLAANLAVGYAMVGVTVRSTVFRVLVLVQSYYYYHLSNSPQCCP